MARNWGINDDFENKRQNIIKRHADELASDYRFKTEQLFRVNVFFNIIDKITVQLKDRFRGMELIKDHFSFLEPKNILNSPQENILENCSRLRKKYPEIFSEKLHFQLIFMSSLLRASNNYNQG